jgi:hypothetical protein
MTLLSTFLLIISLPASLSAQEGATATAETAGSAGTAGSVGHRSEIFVGYGYATSYDIMFPALKLYGTHSTLAGYSERNMRITGAFSVGYKYRFEKVASLGLTYSLGTLKGDVWWGTAQMSEFWGTVCGEHHSLALECDFRYLMKPVFELYSTVGLGVSYSQHKFTPQSPYEANPPRKERFVLPNFHVSLVGIKVGSDRVGGFAELGFGYKGILNLGAYVRF